MIDVLILEKYLVVKKKLGKRTIQTYIDAAKRLNKRMFGDEELTQEFFEDFVMAAESNMGGGGVNNYILAFNHYIDALDHYDIPCKLKKLEPREVMTEPVREIMTKEEIEALFTQDVPYSGDRKRNEFLNRVYKTAFLLMGVTGCRNGECRKLLVRDIDFAMNQIWFVKPKNKHTRFTILSKPLYEPLRALTVGRKPDDHIFTTSEGGPLTQSMLSDDIHYRAKRAGISKHVRCHLLRHSFAASLTERGVEISAIAKLLGHQNVNTTYTQYGHYNSKLLKESIEHLPIIQESLTPAEILRQDLEVIKRLRIFNDPRFFAKITEGEHSLNFVLAEK